jgi:hypothetical protein
VIVRKANRLILSFVALTLFQTGTSGGFGGGSGPPAVQLEEAELMALNSRVIDGESLIKLQQPGFDEVYLRPQLDSIKARSLSTQSLKTGDTTVFYSPEPVETTQRKLAVTFAKTVALTMAPGVLSIGTDDLTIKPKPTVEVIPSTDVPDDWLIPQTSNQLIE